MIAANDMPSESGLAANTINYSNSSNRTSAEPRPASPNLQGNQNKARKHVVLTGRAHTRNFSNRGSNSKLHGDLHLDAGGNRKPQRNASTASLRKTNNPHAYLKRKRSSAEVKPKFTAAFELGDHEEGWEETSSSTSPTASRSNSRPTSKSQTTMTNFQDLPHPLSSSELLRGPSDDKKLAHPPSSTQPKGITERLLSRTPCQHTTHTSLEVATPVVNSHSSPSSPNRMHSLYNRKLSLFAANSNTNLRLSQFLFNHPASAKGSEDVKRAQSMRDFAHSLPDEEERSILNSYQLGVGQSRTLQKQWLQRASSIIEPKQLDINNGNEVGFFAGPTYEGPISRLKSMLARTGTEYLIIRRYHDPIGNSLKRIVQIPGMGRNWRIPSKPKKTVDTPVNNGGGRYGLSQSLRSYTQLRNSTSSSSTSRGHKNIPGPCHDINESVQTYLDVGNGSSNAENEEIIILLRKLWDKSPDLTI